VDFRTNIPFALHNINRSILQPRFRVFTARCELSPHINRNAWSVSNRSLNALGTNYVGLESPENVGSSVLNFAWDGVGHTVAERCMEELRVNFRGDIWGYNGPELITRVIQQMCNCSRVSHRAVGTA
jgi:hypothetical protein